MVTQLTLFGKEESVKQEPVQYPEIDSTQIWRIALYDYNEKKFRMGWRPWHKKGKQNDSSSR
jgi:hypothetical protein